MTKLLMGISRVVFIWVVGLINLLSPPDPPGRSLGVFVFGEPSGSMVPSFVGLYIFPNYHGT